MILQAFRNFFVGHRLQAVALLLIISLLIPSQRKGNSS